MNRRDFLAKSGTALTPLLAGCSGSSGEEETAVTLCELQAVNLTQTTKTVAARLTIDEETVYSHEEELVGRNDESGDGLFYVSSEELPDEPQKYRVHARLNGQDWEKEYLPDVAQEPTQVLISVEEGVPHPLIWPHRCD